VRLLPIFTACRVPIGAYEPRWFMQPVHVSPEEAVRRPRAVSESRFRTAPESSPGRRPTASGRAHSAVNVVPPGTVSGETNGVFTT
jgi:L-ascorbate metabolism protein UlaG (beta-lactamase superfamily)